MNGASLRPVIHDENLSLTQRLWNGAKNFASAQWCQISTLVHSKFTAEKEKARAVDPNILQEIKWSQQLPVEPTLGDEGEDKEDFSSFEGEELDDEGTSFVTPADKQSLLFPGALERLVALRKASSDPDPEPRQEKLVLTLDEFEEVYFNLLNMPTEDTSTIIAEQLNDLDGRARKALIQAIIALVEEHDPSMTSDKIEELVNVCLVDPFLEVTFANQEQPIQVMSEAILKVKAKELFYQYEYAESACKNIEVDFEEQPMIDLDSDH